MAFSGTHNVLHERQSGSLLATRVAFVISNFTLASGSPQPLCWRYSCSSCCQRLSAYKWPSSPLVISALSLGFCFPMLRSSFCCTMLFVGCVLFVCCCRHRLRVTLAVFVSLLRVCLGSVGCWRCLSCKCDLSSVVDAPPVLYPWT